MERSESSDIQLVIQAPMHTFTSRPARTMRRILTRRTILMILGLMPLMEGTVMSSTVVSRTETMVMAKSKRFHLLNQ